MVDHRKPSLPNDLHKTAPLNKIMRQYFHLSFHSTSKVLYVSVTAISTSRPVTAASANAIDAVFVVVAAGTSI